MTPSRFIECLAYMNWSREKLADILECEEGLVHAWATGREEIPVTLVVWLEGLATCHEAAGIPTTWRKKNLRHEP